MRELKQDKGEGRTSLACSAQPKRFHLNLLVSSILPSRELTTRDCMAIYNGGMSKDRNRQKASRGTEIETAIPDCVWK